MVEAGAGTGTGRKSPLEYKHSWNGRREGDVLYPNWLQL